MLEFEFSCSTLSWIISCLTCPKSHVTKIDKIVKKMHNFTESLARKKPVVMILSKNFH
jgi:hypothetical protein